MIVNRIRTVYVLAVWNLADGHYIRTDRNHTGEKDYVGEDFK